MTFRCVSCWSQAPPRAALILQPLHPARRVVWMSFAIPKSHRQDLPLPRLTSWWLTWTPRPRPPRCSISFKMLPPARATIALIDDPDPAWVRSALRASIHAVISRDANSEDMQMALQAADAGFVLLHPTSVHGLLQDNAIAKMNDLSGEDFAQDDLASEDVAEDLTARESEVLRLVSMGLGNKEIAVRLAISEHTAKFHISSILGKLHAGSRTEAVSLGIRKGLIPI